LISLTWEEEWTPHLNLWKIEHRYVAKISAHAKNGSQENEFRQVKSSRKSYASSVEIPVEPEFEPRFLVEPEIWPEKQFPP
jgi:hypothetical protein